MTIRDLTISGAALLLTVVGGCNHVGVEKEAARVDVAEPAIVEQYFNLSDVGAPGIISSCMTVQSTALFEEAPVRIIVYADFLCPDYEFLNRQLNRLAEEFQGQINIAIQFFPLDAQCNSVVDKDFHPGACDLSYMSAYDPANFKQIHDEIFDNFESAGNSEWRAELARKHGVEAALTDEATKDLVHQIINTGMDYEKTSAEFAFGIRSTPTMILNNKMLIGTFSDEDMRAIFQALIEEHEKGGRQKFLENWEPR